MLAFGMNQVATRDVEIQLMLCYFGGGAINANWSLIQAIGLEC
jgi:hypothetical protein